MYTLYVNVCNCPYYLLFKLVKYCAAIVNSSEQNYIDCKHWNKKKCSVINDVQRMPSSFTVYFLF